MIKAKYPQPRKLRVTVRVSESAVRDERETTYIYEQSCIKSKKNQKRSAGIFKNTANTQRGYAGFFGLSTI